MKKEINVDADILDRYRMVQAALDLNITPSDAPINQRRQAISRSINIRTRRPRRAAAPRRTQKRDIINMVFAIGGTAVQGDSQRIRSQVTLIPKNVPALCLGVREGGSVGSTHHTDGLIEKIESDCAARIWRRCALFADVGVGHESV